MTPRPARGRSLAALIVCFYAGIAVGWLTHAAYSRPQLAIAREAEQAQTQAVATTGNSSPEPAKAASVERDAGVAARPAADAPAADAQVADPIRDLRSRNLRLPLDAASVELMKGGFAERRDSGGRGHEAVDLLAPRNTPVHAVEDGTIAKLFHSKAGGTTIYQFDPSGRFCYYYAHLDHYASGLHDGQRVARGDVIGYVGTTGNAPANTPHLHFAIFELGPERHWWQGTPLDPYLVYR